MKNGFWGKNATWTGIWTIGIGIVGTAGFSAMLYDGCNNQQILNFPVPVTVDGAKPTKMITFGTGAFNYGEIDIDDSVDVNKEFPEWPQNVKGYKNWLNSLNQTKKTLNTQKDSITNKDSPEFKVIAQQLDIIDAAKNTYTLYITGATLTPVFALIIIGAIALLIVNKKRI